MENRDNSSCNFLSNQPNSMSYKQDVYRKRSRNILWNTYERVQDWECEKNSNKATEDALLETCDILNSYDMRLLESEIP